MLQWPRQTAPNKCSPAWTTAAAATAATAAAAVVAGAAAAAVAVRVAGDDGGVLPPGEYGNAAYNNIAWPCCGNSDPMTSLRPRHQIGQKARHDL